MSRRGSACAIALMITLANGSPMAYSNSCSPDDAVIKSLQTNGEPGVVFYKNYVPAPPAPPTTVVPEAATSTLFVGDVTTTETVTKTATLTYTVAEDRLVRVTSSKLCPNGTPVPVGPVRGGSPVGVVAPGPVGVVAPEPPRRGGRDAALPEYVRAYQPAQVSNACNCLLAPASTVSVTSTTIVTQSVPTVTKHYTKYNDSPILSYKRIVATRTAVSISCITPPPIALAPAAVPVAVAG